MKRIFIAVSFVISSIAGYSQQNIMLSQYMFNHLLVNPGYAGSKEYIMATLLYRNQWVGWDNAPTTQVASLHGPLGTTNMGWGALISHDHEGVTDRTDMYANFAYHLTLNPKLKLGLGLRAGGAYWVHKGSQLKVWDKTDPLFSEDKTEFLPNIGTGLYLYNKKFYIGTSIPEVLSYDPTTELNVASSATIDRQVRHHYFTAGVAIPVASDIVLKPSTLLKYTWAAPPEADFNLEALFYNVLWIGGSYRTGDAFVAMTQVVISKQWTVGYSYDFTFTDIKNYSSGAHEIMVGYDFGYDIQKIKTPRYF